MMMRSIQGVVIATVILITLVMGSSAQADVVFGISPGTSVLTIEKKIPYQHELFLSRPDTDIDERFRVEVRGEAARAVNNAETRYITLKKGEHQSRYPVTIDAVGLELGKHTLQIEFIPLNYEGQKLDGVATRFVLTAKLKLDVVDKLTPDPFALDASVDPSVEQYISVKQFSLENATGQSGSSVNVRITFNNSHTQEAIKNVRYAILLQKRGESPSKETAVLRDRIPAGGTNDVLAETVFFNRPLPSGIYQMMLNIGEKTVARTPVIVIGSRLFAWKQWSIPFFVVGIGTTIAGMYWMVGIFLVKRLKM